MAKLTKAQQTERAEAIERLREWIKPGDTVYTLLNHVSKSGMMRTIRVVLLFCSDGKVSDIHPNYAVGRALGLKHWTRNGRKQDALVVSGCGMDMGFHLVYSLSRVLYPAGFRCVGKGCLSNDHSNGDGDLKPYRHYHSDGGYALRHRWL